MPNSGVFYSGGKFHISKLSSDLVQFAGQVEATGIALADNQETGQGSESIVLPTATQVVDYVKSSIASNSTYALAQVVDPASSAFSFTALSAQADTLTEKERHDNRSSELFARISSGMEEAERLDSVERTRAMLAESNLQAELDAVELAAGLNADGTFSAHTGSNYLGSAGTMKAVDAALDAQAKQNADDIVVEQQRAIGVETGLQSELDATQSGAGLTAAGAYQADGTADYISTASSLADADSKLDDQIKVNADAIAQEASDRLAADTLLRGDVDSALGTTVPAFSVTASGLATANGYNSTFNGATTVKAALEALDSAIFAMLDGSTVNLDQLAELVSAYEDMDADVFKMVEGMFGFTGMVSTPTLNADGVANEVIAFSYSGTNYLNSAATLKAADILLDGAIKVNFDAIAAEVVRATGAEVALGNRIDAVNTAAGISGDAYTANASMNYIATASSLKDADEKLDAALKAEEVARIADDATLQANIDAEEQARIASDGNLSFTYVDSNGQPASATDLTAAINELGAAVASSNTTVQAELDATQTALGMTAHASATAGNGGYYMPAVVAPAASGAYFKVGSDISAGSSLVAMFGSVQSDMQAMSEAFEQEDLDLHAELDATQIGAGLEANGGYAANVSANYVQAASSLKDADNKLDAQAKANADAISAETTRATGAEQGIQAELDATQGALGASISALGAYVSHTGKNYINGNADLTEDIVDLDAKMKIEEDSLDASQADIFASGGTLAADFSINGSPYTTIEGAINAISGSLGDSDIDFSADSGTGSVDLASQVMAITSASTGNTLQGPATNLITEASAQSVTIKLKPEIQVDEVRAQFVQSAVVGSSLSVQHAPFVADEAMESGAIVCVQKGGTRKYGIENADIGDSAKIEILGMAFDPASTTGGITAHTFAAGDAVAIVKSGQNVEGVSFGAKDQSGNTLTYAVGDALYMGVDDMGTSCITKAIPSDDGAVPFDAKAVISLGFVSAINLTNGATADAMWFEVKLVAMEA